MRNIRHFFLVLFFCISGFAFAQNIPYPARKIIQFSGVVINSADLTPIPYTHVVIKEKNRGTVANINGFFSFAAITGETVEFSSMGHIVASFTIPDTLSSDHYSIIQPMAQDTIELAETVIYPWPSKEKFREAFLTIVIPEDEVAIMRRNFTLAEMRERARHGKMDGSLNYKNLMQQQIDQLYYKGQVMPNNLLNPFAWGAFIKKWKEYKRAEKVSVESEESYEEY